MRIEQNSIKKEKETTQLECGVRGAWGEEGISKNEGDGYKHMDGRREGEGRGLKKL